jgi:hypothetical protein
MLNPLSGKDKLLSLRSAALPLAACTWALPLHKAQEFLKNNPFTITFSGVQIQSAAPVGKTGSQAMLYIRKDLKNPRIHPISNLKSKIHESPKPPFF